MYNVVPPGNRASLKHLFPRADTSVTGTKRDGISRAAFAFFCSTLVALFWYVPPCLADGRLQEVLRKIEESEQPLQAFRADFEVTKADGTPLWRGQFGFERGKAYRRGEAFRTINGKRAPYAEIYAFDGTTLTTYQPDENSRAGTVCELEGDISAVMTPASLLGRSLSLKGCATLSEILGMATDLELVSESENVNGHPCCLLQGKLSYPYDSQQGKLDVPGLFQVWVDPQRGLRPLMEKRYIDTEGKDLLACLDQIELAEIQGVWLPVSGRTRDRATRLIFEDEEGKREISQEQAMELASRVPEEKLRQQLRIESYLDDPAGNLLSVTKWEIVDDLDDTLFTVQFPVGASVWNDLLQEGYVVGRVAEDMAIEPPALTPPEPAQAAPKAKASGATAGASSSPTVPKRNTADGARWRVVLPIGVLVGGAAIAVVAAAVTVIVRRQRSREPMAR